MKKHNIFFGVIIFMFSAPIFSSIIRVLMSTSSEMTIWSSRRLMIIGKTLVYGLSVSLLTCVIGAMVAYFLVRQYKHVRFMSLFILCLMGIPPYYYAYLAMDFSRVFLNMPFISGFMVSVIVEVLYLLPLAISAWLLFISSIPVVYLEEAMLFINKKQAIRKVLMSLMVAPGKSLVFLLALIAMNDYTIPSIFAYNTYPIEVMTVFASQIGLSAPLIISLPMMLISLILMGLIFRNWQQMDMRFVEQSNTLLSQQKKRSWLGIVLWIIYIGIPVGLMGHGFFSQSMDIYFSQSFVTDLIFGHGAAIFAGLVSTVVVYYLCYLFFRHNVLKKWILSFVVILFSIPGTLVGLMVNGLYQWLDSFLGWNLYSTIIPMIHLLSIRYIAVGFLIIWIGLNSLHKSAIDVALLHTKSTFKILYQVIWPYSKYYVISGFLVMSILGMGELSGTIMVTPPGKSTMTITIYNYLHYGSGDVVSFLVMLMFFMIVIFSAGIVMVLNKLEREKG